MKKTILLLLVLSFAFSFSSCEKDDICDGNTITTPRLVITFYDANNASVTKNATNLSIFSEGMDEAVSFSGNTLINGSTVSIPLKVNAESTTFRFILNYGSTSVVAPANEDIIKFNYRTQNIYVSRACGYKTNYTLDSTTPFVHSDAATPDQKWINVVYVSNPIIANENETHLEIYF